MPDYQQRLIARTDLFNTVVNPMTVPLIKVKYLPNTFKGNTPCIALYSSGTDDVNDLSLKGNQPRRVETAYTFRVSLLALYADNRTPPTYYEAQAYDQIDKMSDELLDLVRAHRRVANLWQSLTWEGMSVFTEPMKIDGSLYLHEQVFLKLTLY